MPPGPRSSLPRQRPETGTSRTRPSTSAFPVGRGRPPSVPGRSASVHTARERGRMAPPLTAGFRKVCVFKHGKAECIAAREALEEHGCEILQNTNDLHKEVTCVLELVERTRLEECQDIPQSCLPEPVAGAIGAVSCDWSEPPQLLATKPNQSGGLKNVSKAMARRRLACLDDVPEIEINS